MTSINETPESIDVRCPSCRERFSVSAELMGRMVECGACKARFRISDDVILKKKRFYPGERDQNTLSHFQRVSDSAIPPEGAQKDYADFNKNHQLARTSRKYLIAGIIGVGLVAAVSIPYFLKSPKTSFTDAGVSVKTSAPLPPPDEMDDSLKALRERFTTTPLEAEQERLKSSGSEKKAYGIYLTNLLRRNIYTVRDYLIRESFAGTSSHPYPRDNDDYLMVLTDVSLEITELAKIAGLLGATKEVHPEIGVIVVSVNNEQFDDSTSEQLNNHKDPSFYTLNQRELASIDMNRVKLAVERLASATPSIYREDIGDALLKLMEKPGINFHDELSKALLVWLVDPSLAGKAALNVLQSRIAADQPISENLVELLLKAKNQDAIPSVHTIWLRNPLIWERQYAEFGSVIEPNVLEQLNSENAPLVRSAIKILGRIGTQSSLPALHQLAGAQDPEVRVLTERAIQAIKGR